MTKRGPGGEAEEPAALRRAAVEVLNSAARQKDPHEFDRLARYALALIDRARAIRRGRHPNVSKEEGRLSQSERWPQREDDSSGLRKSTAELINKLWRGDLWKIKR
jgi:hypothetical protein